jgi:hypothetical protein
MYSMSSSLVFQSKELQTELSSCLNKLILEHIIKINKQLKFTKCSKYFIFNLNACLVNLKLINILNINFVDWIFDLFF